MQLEARAASDACRLVNLTHGQLDVVSGLARTTDHREICVGDIAHRAPAVDVIEGSHCPTANRAQHLCHRPQKRRLRGRVFSVCEGRALDCDRHWYPLSPGVCPDHYPDHYTCRNAARTCDQMFDRDWPPSTLIVAPTSHDARGEARKATTSATSSARPKRPAAIFASMKAAIPSGSLSSR
jgi:hypothetical protein